MSAYPKFRVTLTGREPFEVQSAFKDMTRFERTAHENGLPGVSEAPVTWTGNIAFLAAKRLNLIEQAMPWDAFEDQVESIEAVEEAAEPDPTHAAP